MISSVRIEASADTPADVVRYVEAALSRLQLGNGAGEHMFGASEFVIEGQDAGFKARVKLNYGPMGAAAEGMWFEGKDPYGADHDECNRRRAELNAAHATSGLFDPPPPGGDLFPPEAVVLEAKVSIPIVVQGHTYTLEGLSLSALGSTVMQEGFRAHRTTLREVKDWELRDAGGTLLDPDEELNVSNIWFPLHLNPKAGIGG